MKHSSIFPIILATALSALLVGCSGGGGGGGGGGESSSSNITTNQTTQFIDAPAAGLYFAASPSGITGTTDSSGNVSFKNGDTVSLYLGGENGVKLASFIPIEGSQVFVPIFDNYMSISQLLLSLDGSGSSTYMDFSKIATIPSATKAALTSFISSGLSDEAVLLSARTAIQAANAGLIYRSATVPSQNETAIHLTGSSSTIATPPSSLRDNSAFNNSPFFTLITTVSGVYAGERQSSYVLNISDTSKIEYSADDSFTQLSPIGLTRSNSISTSQTGISITDKFTGLLTNYTCPISNITTAVANVAGGVGLINKYSQNLNSSSSQCETKSAFISSYPLDVNFSVAALKGKTLTTRQSCGNATNTIAITTDANGGFSITGNICSIKQQGYYNASNVRNVNFPTVANGDVSNVSDFPSLVRLTPAGYNATMRAAHAPTMLLSRSVDGKSYYFNISDGDSPGQLAGGVLKFVSLQ